MAGFSARAASLVALELWQTQGQRADTILNEVLAAETSGSSDRAFTVELFYGVLRNLALLDFWIDCLRPAHVDADVRDVLRLGLYQLLILGTREHAAVYESVELVKRKLRPVVNGVLRSAVRQQEELLTRTQAQPLSIRESHPPFLVARWQRKFGAKETAALCKWNNQPPPIYARINQLKISPEQFYHRYPGAESWSSNAEFARFPSFPIDAIERGHCYIQDPSTAMACRLLDPQPGEAILDACAAPGGKTTYLAGLMQNRGEILACDREPARLDVLKENVARLGATIVRTIPNDWLNPRALKIMEANALFDRALVDVPCTNTGVIRRRVDVRWRLQPADFLRMQEQQFEIVATVFRLLKPSGVLVYSTCSLEPEENIGVVNRILNAIPGLQLVEQKDCLPFRDQCDGAFAAKIIKTGT